MLERAQTRALPVLNRTADFAPAAQACCGVCRTCATTNVVTMLAAGFVAVAAYATRWSRRIL
jgi:hypothetical protein